MVTDGLHSTRLISICGQFSSSDNEEPVFVVSSDLVFALSCRVVSSQNHVGEEIVCDEFWSRLKRYENSLRSVPVSLHEVREICVVSGFLAARSFCLTGVESENPRTVNAVCFDSPGSH